MSSKAEPVLLSFAREGETAESFTADLSAVTQIGEELWVGSDEGTGLARLTRVGADAWGAARAVPLAETLDLPAGEDDEIDVEGLGAAGGCLWITGSHSPRRTKVEQEDTGDVARGLERLSRVKRRGNRYLLARLPLSPEAGSPARLSGGRRRNALTDILEDDEHLARFLRIPGKDNGFNIEGLAVAEGRVLLGLRGPVLRGWAVVLVLAPEDDPAKPGRLRLGRVEGKRRYAKIFLDLRGLGIRDLAWDGDDLLILAGPTMALRSDALVLRWPNALGMREDAFVGRDELRRVHELPYGAGTEESVDHPEGLALLRDGSERSLLVVYDSPSPARRRDRGGVIADRFRL